MFQLNFKAVNLGKVKICRQENQYYFINYIHIRRLTCLLLFDVLLNTHKMGRVTFLEIQSLKHVESLKVEFSWKLNKKSHDFVIYCIKLSNSNVYGGS